MPCVVSATERLGTAASAAAQAWAELPVGARLEAFEAVPQVGVALDELLAAWGGLLLAERAQQALRTAEGA